MLAFGCPTAAHLRRAIIARRAGKSRESEPRMTARILDGNAIRDQIFSELSAEIRRLAARGIRPGLAAVLAGDNPASKLYVSSKIAACAKLGLARFLLTPPATIPTAGLLSLVGGLNRPAEVDG